MSKLNIAAIIQARAGSTRLPRKVLENLGGKTMLARVIERVERVERFCSHPVRVRVIVATTDLATDEPVAVEAAARGAFVVRGSAHDVLSRYHDAVLQSDQTGFCCDAILRITADCPLLDPETTARVVDAFAGGGCDYASNTLVRTFPRGLDSEVLSRAALEIAHREATDAQDREHVTCFVWRQPQRFRLRNVADPVDRSQLRWTVDTIEDLLVVQDIYHALYLNRHYDAISIEPARPIPAYAEILALVAQDSRLSDGNAHVEQKKLTGI